MIAIMSSQKMTKKLMLDLNLILVSHFKKKRKERIEVLKKIINKKL